MSSSPTANFSPSEPKQTVPSSPLEPTGRRRAIRSLRIVPAVAALTIVAAACGSAAASDGGLASSGGDDVATLEDTIVAEVMEDGEGDDAESTPEGAALAFSQCMRDEGLDFPDLAVDAEGNINLREGFDAVDQNDESFREARDACQDELAAGGFGGGRREALESPEVQDGLVAYSDCIRDQGFDVGDLTLGGQGAGQGGQGTGTQNGTADADGDADGAGDGDGPPAGQRQQGFGNRNNRLAQQLGLDPEDPDVAEALETCSPVLEEAFAAVGVGPANDNG